MELRRSVNTKIWDDVWFMDLSHEYKLLWFYLITNTQTNMLGIYEISLRKISFDTGLDLETILKAFKDFQTLSKAKYHRNYVILYNWIKNQSYNPNMIKSAVSEFEKLPTWLKIETENHFIYNLKAKNETLSKPLEAFQTLPKKEKEKEDEKEDEKEAFKVHENLFNEILNDEIWIESLMVNHKRDLLEVKTHLERFKNDCVTRKIYKSSKEDLIKHFSNWLKYNEIPKIAEVLRKKKLENNFE
jgi:hypothetical protein